MKLAKRTPQVATKSDLTALFAIPARVHEHASTLMQSGDATLNIHS
jgi:hypothetical protein